MVTGFCCKGALHTASRRHKYGKYNDAEWDAMVSKVNNENKSHGYIIELSIRENMDRGKSPAAFHWAHKYLSTSGHAIATAMTNSSLTKDASLNVFVGKSDLDTYIDYSRVIELLPANPYSRFGSRFRSFVKSNHVFRAIYFGQSHSYGQMCTEGAFYMLSWPLLNFIASQKVVKIG